MSLTVVQTLPALESGGVERGTVEVAKALVERGHRSIVISAGGRLVAPLQRQGSEHIELPIGKKNPLTFCYVSHLRKLLMERRVDILHSRSRLPAWVSWLAWKSLSPAMRPRFVTTVHGAYSVNAYSRVMVRGEKIIAISRFIKDYILLNYPGIDAEQITVIPRGVSTEEFPHGFKADANWMRQWQKEFSFLQDKFVITLPARITRRKGHEDFINIMADLKNTGVNIHGVIAGGAHRRRQKFYRELKARVETQGLDNDITFLGHRDDLREVMAASDLVLSLSREPEAFGRTALEALSLGVPVIAYDHGGAREVLQAMFPQGLVALHDWQAVVKKIAAFYEHPVTVAKLSPFPLQAMLEKTLALYENAVPEIVA